MRRGKVTLVDKANVLATSRLWRETVTELYQKEYAAGREPGDGYPAKNRKAIVLDYMFVDNAAMQLITAPASLDVVLTENLFGDILSDEASVITGSIGLLPSASVGDKVSLYEPIHGSYPQAAGKNIANPIAAILSGVLLLEYSFHMQEEAQAIRNACKTALENGIVTPDLAAEGAAFYGTEETGNYIAELIR